MLTGRQTLGYWLLVLPLVAAVAAFYGWPLLGILGLSITDPTPGLGNYAKLATDPALIRLIWTTLRICAITTVFSLLGGYLLAYVMTQSRAEQRNWMLMLVMMSFWISVLVRAFAWLMLLGRNGLLNSLLLRAGIVDEPLTLVR